MPTSAQPEGLVGGTRVLELLVGDERFEVSDHVDNEQPTLCHMSVCAQVVPRLERLVGKEGRLVDGDVSEHSRLRLVPPPKNYPMTAGSMVEVTAEILD